MSCNSRICEPCKVSEILAGACLVGRPAAAVSALLGFNTHLDLSDLLFLLVILTQPESPYLHFQVRPHASVYEFRHMDFAARQAPAWPRSISRSFMRSERLRRYVRLGLFAGLLLLLQLLGHLLTLLGAGLFALLALLVQLLLGSQQFDVCHLGGIALACAATRDPGIAAVAVAVTGRDHVEQPVD